MNDLGEFASVEIDVAELRAMLRQSKEFFIEYFIGDALGDHPVEDFHLMIFDRFTDMRYPRDVAALPRDHAKTTYLRLSYAYLAAFSPLEFFVCMGPEKGAASHSMQVVWSYISSPEYQNVFGEVTCEIFRPSEGFIQGSCTWWDEAGEPHKKLLIIKAQGAQQQVRGMNIFGLRPQFVGCDDIETEDDIRTEEGYFKFKSWFDNTFMRAVSRQTGMNKVAQIGNLVGYKTLLNDNLQDPDWRSIRLGILRRNGQPLWASRFSLESIKADFAAAKRRGQLAGWFAELMNMPINLETSLINYEKIKYTPVRNPADGSEYHSFITIDPAGDGATSDEAAIVLHTLDPATLTPQITEYVHARAMTPAIMVEEIKKLCLRWNCSVIGCEAVMLQKVFLSYFELSFLSDSMVGYQFVPIMVGRKHKTARLKVWASAVENGEYTLAAGDWDIVNQLLQFDIRKDNNLDDLIDASSMGLYMLENYKYDILTHRAGTQIDQCLTPTPGDTSI